jgi:hypothetical protein
LLFKCHYFHGTPQEQKAKSMVAIRIRPVAPRSAGITRQTLQRDGFNPGVSYAPHCISGRFVPQQR